jgi:hypothetical protein
LIGGDDSLMAIPQKQQNSNSTPTDFGKKYTFQ